MAVNLCKGCVFIGTTLDGYIAQKDGNIDYLMDDNNYHKMTDEQKKEDGDRGFSDFLASVDVVIMGRGTLQGIPLDHPWIYGDKPVIVLSDTLKELPKEVPDTVTIRSNVDPVEFMKEMYDKGFKRAYIDGGKVIHNFMKNKVITEMVISVIPLLLGSGIPLFIGDGSYKEVKLKVDNSKVFHNGIVQTIYTVL